MNNRRQLIPRAKGVIRIDTFVSILSWKKEGGYTVEIIMMFLRVRSVARSDTINTRLSLVQVSKIYKISRSHLELVKVDDGHGSWVVGNQWSVKKVWH